MEISVDKQVTPRPGVSAPNASKDWTVFKEGTSGTGVKYQKICNEEHGPRKVECSALHSW